MFLWLPRKSFRQPKQIMKKPIFICCIIIFIILICGYYFYRLVVNYGEKIEHQNLLQLTVTAGASIDPEWIESLEGIPADIKNPNYKKIRAQIRRIKKVNKNARFVYLMALKNGKVIYLADAETEDSVDYSRPGDIYEEVSPELFAIFSNGNAFIEGPSEDSWGEWVSGKAPVIDSQTRIVTAIIGIDINADVWRKTIAFYWWFNILVVGFIIIIVLLFSCILFQINYSRKKLQSEIFVRKQAEEALGKTNQKLFAAKSDLEFEIFQRKQTEEQQEVLLGELEWSNRELEAFAHVVSHDLKAPLRGVRSIAGWITEDYARLLDSRGREYLDELAILTRRMNSFIEDILRYARIDKCSNALEDFASKAVVEEVIEYIAPPENISVHVAEDLPTVQFERNLLQQLLQNLIANAVMYLGKPRGDVSVSCNDADDFWEFCVRDNGVGIEAKHRDEIFAMFYSLNPDDSKESTGIGLAIVKKICQRFGGKVWVESEVGKGSAFFFTIPKVSSLKLPGSCYNVLIIDDNIDFIKLTARLLELNGYTALFATNANDVFKLLIKHQGNIDAALLDINMPGENIIEIYKKLRDLYPGMKIIICTAEEQSAVSDALVTKGVNGIIYKPFNMKKLNQVLQQASTDGLNL